MLNSICERHGATVHAADAINVPGDTVQLTQLFTNVIQNAAAFGEAVTVLVTQALYLLWTAPPLATPLDSRA